MQTKLGIVVAVALSCWVSVPLHAQHGQYYVLDGFGGVHTGGGAPAISPTTPYFGFDVARGIVYVPIGNASGQGEGVLVLDGFGGVHVGGALANDEPAPAAPYFGFDIARGIAYRNVPPRSAGAATAVNVTVSSSSAVVIESTTIYAPDDGFLVVNATTGVFCASQSGSTTAQFSLSVDGTMPTLALDAYYVGFRDCSAALPGHATPIQIAALTYRFPVSAGAHTVNFLARKHAGTADITVSGMSITALFIDQDTDGSS